MRKEGESSSRGIINRAWKNFGKSEFDRLYYDFVQKVVAPIMGQSIYYQKEPSFRCIYMKILFINNQLY